MKKTLLSILTLLLIVGFSKVEGQQDLIPENYEVEFLDISKLVLRGNTFYSYKPYKPFTGKVISYRVKNYDVYDLSRLREDKEYVFVEFEGYLKNGKRHGKWIWWKNEKHGWHEATFKNGWKIKN